jgi:hypothetical protein
VRLEETCERTLNHSTDWAALYSQLVHLGVSDPLFQAERFHKVPVKFLRSIAEQLFEQKQQGINAHSVATAKLACLVYGALGGKKNSVSIEFFLPFEKTAKGDGLKDSTIAAIKWAIKHHSLPPAIVGMIGAELA